MFCKLILFSALLAVSWSYVLPESYGQENFEIVPQYMEIYPRINDNSGVHFKKYTLPFLRQRRQSNNFNVGLSHTPGFGTDLNAEARARLWQSNNGLSTLDGNAFYQRHFGGQIGTQTPNYGGGITFTHRF